MNLPASFVDVTQHLTCDEIAVLRRLANGLRLGKEVPDHLVEDLRSELLLNALANAPFLAANRDSLVPLATAHMNYDVLDCIRRLQRRKSRLLDEAARIDDAGTSADADDAAPVWDLPGPDPRLALDDLLDDADRRRLLARWRARFRRRVAALDPTLRGFLELLAVCDDRRTLMSASGLSRWQCYRCHASLRRIFADLLRSHRDIAAL